MAGSLGEIMNDLYTIPPEPGQGRMVIPHKLKSVIDYMLKLCKNKFSGEIRLNYHKGFISRRIKRILVDEVEE